MPEKHVWVPLAGAAVAFGAIWWALSRRKPRDVVGLEIVTEQTAEAQAPISEPEPYSAVTEQRQQLPASRPSLQRKMDPRISATSKEKPLEGVFSTMQSAEAKESESSPEEKLEPKTESTAVIVTSKPMRVQKSASATARTIAESMEKPLQGTFTSMASFQTSDTSPLLRVAPSRPEASVTRHASPPRPRFR